MSGETEASVSGWTTDTLHVHLAQRIDDLDRILSRRMDDADTAIQAALQAAEKAVDKANTANEKRFEGVNEFRKALADQTATFIPRAEYEAARKTITGQIDGTSDRVGAMELRLTSRLDLGEGTSHGETAYRAEHHLNVSQVIAAVAVLTSVVSLIISVMLR